MGLRDQRNRAVCVLQGGEEENAAMN